MKLSSKAAFSSLRAQYPKLLWSVVLLSSALGLAACSGADDPGSHERRDEDSGTNGSADAEVDAGSNGDAGAAADGGESADAAPGDAGHGDVDAASADAGDDSGTPAPFVYQPDPVTMAMDLPSVVPVLRIDIGGQTIQKDVDIAGQIEIFEHPDTTLGNLDALTPEVSAPIAFQGRGNFTFTLPKKGYAFELHDGAGNVQSRALLGMPSGSDFALYACYTDKTCLRNALVYALAQKLGRWSPRGRYVELFLDGSYQGLYMVWERVRKDSSRVRLTKPATTAALGDLSGGYIIRHEGGGKSPPAPSARDWVSNAGVVYTYHYPSEDKISAEQSAYIKDAFQTFEDGMAATPENYAQWIDELSWVDHGIVEEVTNNWDGYVHSIYMTKESDANGGLIGMGPVWDYDLAFGNGNVTGYNCHTDNWAYQIVRDAPDDVPDYWLALYANASFQHAWKCRYQELRKDALTLTTIDAQIAAWKAFTAAARARDQVKWPTLNMSIFPNCLNPPPAMNDYDKEVQYVRDFIAARLTWLDTQAAAMPGACP